MLTHHHRTIIWTVIGVFLAILVLSLVLGCGDGPGSRQDRPGATIDRPPGPDTPGSAAGALPDSQLVPLPTAPTVRTRAAPPLPPPTVSEWRDTVVQSSAAGDSTFVRYATRTQATTDRIDSTAFLRFIPKPPPAEILTALNTLPFGMSGLVPDSLGQGRPYTSVLRLVPCGRLSAAIAEARRAKRTILPGVTRAASKDSNGKLSAAAVGRELACWKEKVPAFEAYVDSGYVHGVYLTDEPHCASCWGGTTANQWQVDSMGMYSKRYFPATLTFVRVKPSWFPVQMYQGHAGPLYIDVGWSVYHPAERLSARAFFDRERDHAKARGFRGMVYNANHLDKGCGPPALTRCMNGVPGSSIGGAERNWQERKLYQMSAAEYEAVVMAGLATEGTCGIYPWMFSVTYPFSRPDSQLAWVRAFQNRADVKAVERRIAAKLMRTPRSGCGTL